MGYDCAKKIEGCRTPKFLPDCCCSPPKPPNRCLLNFRLGYAIYGVISGLMVFFTFGFKFHNWHAAIWGLVSGIYAGVSLIIEIGYRKTKWKEYSSLLIVFVCISFPGIFAGLIAFPMYLAFAIIESQGVTAENRSFYVVCVWCALTFKNALMVVLTSRSYYNLNKLSLNNLNEDIINNNDTSQVVKS